MKVMIEGFEVEIKAKAAGSGKRMNKQDTMRIMNLLSIWAFEAGEHYRKNGCTALEKGAKETAEVIYKMLEAEGCYDNI